eukprot:g24356.t1
MVKDRTQQLWAEWVAEKLSSSFRKTGSFAVVVEASDGTRTEFKVSSVILSSWSEVFDKMMNHDFKEHTQKEVVIKDFSPHGMETFLRFLYSGTLDVDIQTIVEVMAIADKYHVKELSKHCHDLLQLQLSESAKTAWEIIKAADHFRLQDLREVAMRALLMQPKVALEERPAVSDELLHEVLGCGFLCISDEELLDLLMTWKEADEGCASRMDLVGKYVCLKCIPADKIKAMVLMPEFGFFKSVKSKTIRSEHTEDVLYSLQEHCEGQHGDKWHNVFRSDWVSVAHSEGAIITGGLNDLACQNTTEELAAGNWVEWRFPHFAVKLVAIRFIEDVAEGAHFIVSS